ncbi:MAG: hypothetical protein AAF570_11780, partial [Bacteroidota bacterium]
GAPFVGTSYYRIHKVAMDGTSQYSNVLSLAVSKSAGGFEVGPTPGNGEMLTIRTSAQMRALNIYDITGSRVFSQSLDAAIGAEMEIHPDLTQGIFQVEMTDAAGRKFVKKIVVQ